MMYTLPLRRTSWLARWRLRRDFNELRTFMGRAPKKQPALGAGWKRSCDLCPIRRRRSTLKTNVRNARSHGLSDCRDVRIDTRGEPGAAGVACRFAVFRYLSSRNRLPLTRIMLMGDRQAGPRSIHLSPAGRVVPSQTR